MEVISFRLYGDYALFKKPWCNLQQQSYLIPPKTTVIGIIGGILGYGKEEYLTKLNFEEIKIGIEIRATIKKEVNGFNYMHGKEMFSRTKFKGLSNVLRNPTNKGQRSPTKLELLKNADYRIYIAFNNKKLQDNFYSLIEKSQCYFPPFLGQVNLFANISDINPPTDLMEDPFLNTIHTIVPEDAADISKIEGMFFRERIPIQMNTDRSSPQYKSFVFYNEHNKELPIIPKKGYIIGKLNIRDNEKRILLF
ncbi:MAG: type I-B CRISPR-associated protein Cas5 [Candidatus Altiarchaeales archaeon A3]|nr:MAG: type I-B CRISPR-associated protein Cas5 [Candidatus Altiarchaeales archaeon A3]